MKIQRIIIGLGLLLILITTFSFLSIRGEYQKQLYVTTAEIAGMEKIAQIHHVSIMLKDVRGSSQFEDRLIAQIRNQLSIFPEVVQFKLQELGQEELQLIFKQIIDQELQLPQAERFNKYSYLINELDQMQFEISDTSFLLFEPERDPYFLMLLSVSEMTKMTEQIGKIRGAGTAQMVSLLEDSNNRFLLKNNYELLKLTLLNSQKIINKLSESSQRIILPEFDPLTQELKDLSQLLSSELANVSQEAFFLKVSESLKHANHLFKTTKKLLIEKLELRKSKLESKMVINDLVYFTMLIGMALAIFLVYRKFNQDLEKKNIDDIRNSFIKKLQNSLISITNLKDICDQSLASLIKEFGGLSGSIYLWHEKNHRLYLGATYGTGYSQIKHQLKAHESLIGETLLSSKINILDVKDKIEVGGVFIGVETLIILPLITFDKKVGVIQILFLKKTSQDQIDFLNEIGHIFSSHIYKSQQENDAQEYVKQIDRNILFSKTDLKGRIIDVSQEFCNLSQYSKEELIGQTHQIIRHPDSPKALFEDLWRTIKKGEVWRGEIKNKAKDGSFYWVQSTISPDYDLYGNIIGFSSIRHNISDKKKIEMLSITDPLTGLFNRRHFDDVFVKQLAIAKRYNRVLNFALIDIDHFKQYNDVYGHQAGDEALKSVASSLKESLKRPDDYVFRLGGEEFGLMFYTKDAKRALHKSNQIIQAIEHLNIAHRENSASNYVTISMGLYTLESPETHSLEDIYKQADDALYQAKEQGRNQIVEVLP